ncbi:MAG: RimK-like ATPgrasp N-terminal domain-containing protein, partial [Pseudoalteromonas spongiae]
MVKTLIVVDDTQTTSHNDIKAIDFATYLKDYPKRDEPKTRVINLCESSRYLSQGYYCSLLAEARGHDVLPSVKTLNNLRAPTQTLVSRKYLDKTVCNDGETCSVLMCFGRVQDEKMQKLAAREGVPALIVMTRARPGTRLAEQVAKAAAETGANLAKAALS